MKNSHAQKGFTLVEALVAIFILTAAITAPLQIAYQGIAATTYAKNQLTAQFLAQDAAEFILAKKLQDATPTETEWLTTFADCIEASDGGNGCVINTNVENQGNNAVDACGATCPVLNYNSNTGIYSQLAPGGTNNGWKATPFRRKIVLEKINGSDAEVRAYITVTWSSSLDARKSFTVRYNFYKEVLQ